jgi:hypothetical protein
MNMKKSLCIYENNMESSSNIELSTATKQCRLCENVLSTSCFNKHSGTKDKLDGRCKECMKECKKRSKLTEVKTYPVYPLDFTNTDWQLGKPSGSILLREDPKSNAKRYEVRIPMGDSSMKSKSFAFSNYDTEEDAKKDAEAWLIQFSKDNGLTKNMIRIKNENTIEVQLTKGCVMQTDMQFEKICQMYPLCSKKCSHPNAQYYPLIIVNKTNTLFHKHITGYDMTDHINRNPMDNRLCNLRATTPKLNNNNRGMNKKYKDDLNHVMGVRYVEKDQSWQARIKQNGKEYTKSFSIKKFGDEGAKQLAIETRKTFGVHFQCQND